MREVKAVRMPVPGVRIARLGERGGPLGSGALLFVRRVAIVATVVLAVTMLLSESGPNQQQQTQQNNKASHEDLLCGNRGARPGTLILILIKHYRY